MLLKCWTQYESRFGKPSGHKTWKWLFHSNPKEGKCQESANYHTIVLIPPVSKVLLKILQARLQQYMNWELPDEQAVFRKGEEPEIKLPTFIGYWGKQGNSRKTSTSASLTMIKPFVSIATNCGKFLEMGIPDYLNCLLRNLYAGQEATVRTVDSDDSRDI